MINQPESNKEANTTFLKVKEHTLPIDDDLKLTIVEDFLKIGVILMLL